MGSVWLGGAYGVVTTAFTSKLGDKTFHRHLRRSEQPVFISVADLFCRRAAGRSALDFASISQASDSSSGLTRLTNRPIASAEPTYWDFFVCHHVSLVIGDIQQPGFR
jgi:hypothetical protein